MSSVKVLKKIAVKKWQTCPDMEKKTGHSGQLRLSWELCNRLTLSGSLGSLDFTEWPDLFRKIFKCKLGQSEHPQHRKKKIFQKNAINAYLIILDVFMFWFFFFFLKRKASVIVKSNTNLWCVRRVKKSEFSEGFMRRCVRTVRDRGAGSLSIVLDVFRGATVQTRGLPGRWGAVVKNNAARQLQVGQRTEALLVPELRAVVPSGLVQGAAAAALQPFIGGAPSRWHRWIDLGEARFTASAVVNVVDVVVLAVAGCKHQLLPNRSNFGGRGSVSMATVVRHTPRFKPRLLQRETHAVKLHKK